MGNIYPKVRKGLKEKLNDTSIIEGQILATTDTKEIFVDIEQTRIQLCTYKPGEGDYIEWKYVNREINPYNKIPFVQADGVMEVGRYIDFHINEEDEDHTQRITCNETGLSISGITEGSFKGNLEGKATTSHSAAVINDAGDQRELTFNYSADGIDSCDWLAAWNGNELRAIAMSKFMLAGGTNDSGADVVQCIRYFRENYYMDCYDETWVYSLHSNDNGPVFSKKEFEEGGFPSDYNNAASIFLVFVTANSSGESSYGSEDQMALWIVYYKFYSLSSSKIGKWVKSTLASRNDRKDAEGNPGAWRFSYQSVDDYDKFAIKVNKGSQAYVDIWQMK